MRLAVVLAAVALAGCIDLGHCGLHPEYVGWHDPAFPEALAGVEGWNVTRTDAPTGFASDDARLAAWGATVRRASTHVGDGANLVLYADGSLHLASVPEHGPRPRGEIVAALAEVTDGDHDERAAWADALLASPSYVTHGLDEHGESVRFQAYETELDAHRVHVDGLLGHAELEMPQARATSGDWRFAIAFPTVDARRGAWSFHANAGEGNTFADARWEGEFPEEDAVAEFEAAYGALGVGSVPQDVGVGGAIC